MTFLRAAALAFGLMSASLAALAAPGDPRNGVEFVTLAAPMPVQAAGAKVEVIEFFMYHCPVCNALEPELAAWVKSQGARIAFRRVHLPYSGPNDPEAHLFLTLESMGKADALHDTILRTVHVERQHLMKDEAILEWAARSGFDKNEFMGHWNSFGVTTRLKRLARTATDYGVDSAPTLVVAGKYRTSPALATAGGAQPGVSAMARTVQVLGALVDQAARDSKP